MTDPKPRDSFGAIYDDLHLIQSHAWLATCYSADHVCDEQLSNSILDLSQRLEAINERFSACLDEYSEFRKSLGEVANHG